MKNNPEISKGKYIARLTNNPMRQALFNEINHLKAILNDRGYDVAVSSGIIYDFGLYATVAQLRDMVYRSPIVDAAKQVKSDKEAAQIIENYNNGKENS